MTDRTAAIREAGARRGWRPAGAQAKGSLHAHARVGRLTPLSHAAYHPPDDDAPCAFGRQARLRAFRG